MDQSLPTMTVLAINVYSRAGSMVAKSGVDDQPPSGLGGITLPARVVPCPATWPTVAPQRRARIMGRLSDQPRDRCVADPVRLWPAALPSFEPGNALLLLVGIERRPAAELGTAVVGGGTAFVGTLQDPVAVLLGEA